MSISSKEGNLLLCQFIKYNPSYTPNEPFNPKGENESIIHFIDRSEKYSLYHMIGHTSVHMHNKSCEQVHKFIEHSPCKTRTICKICIKRNKMINHHTPICTRLGCGLCNLHTNSAKISDIKLTNHAAKCTDTQCPHDKCGEMKGYFDHIKQFYPQYEKCDQSYMHPDSTIPCTICHIIIDKIKAHADKCALHDPSKCGVPYCDIFNRKKQIDLHLNLLLHAYTCIEPCNSTNCGKMQGFMKTFTDWTNTHHTEDDDSLLSSFKENDGNNIIKRFRNLLTMHARSCTIKECKVIHCTKIQSLLSKCPINPSCTNAHCAHRNICSNSSSMESSYSSMKSSSLKRLRDEGSTTTVSWKKQMVHECDPVALTFGKMLNGSSRYHF